MCCAQLAENTGRKKSPKGCKIFVLKFDCEIPRGFGEIKVYTFGIGYFNGQG